MHRTERDDCMEGVTDQMEKKKRGENWTQDKSNFKDLFSCCKESYPYIKKKTQVQPTEDQGNKVKKQQALCCKETATDDTVTPGINSAHTLLVE